MEDHERIDELLAGYALLSLAGEDAIEADRLLGTHVPGCPSCRRTLSTFQALSGDLALAADALAPPELLLPRIHRAMRDRPSLGRAPRRRGLLAVASGVVAIVVLSGLAISLGSRVSEVEADRGTALAILSAMRSPGASIDLEPQGGTPAGTSFVEVSAPSVRRIYLASQDCPEPAPGHAYQLWLGSDGAFVPVGEMFVPKDGVVLLELTVDVSRYDEVWITEELVGTRPSRPRTDGGYSWRASL